MTLLDASAKQPEPTAATPARAWRFRADIEGLRGIAVLAVVLYHAGVAVTPGGYVGVDVFFVISGFLITGHLLGELQTTGRISLTRFYARRARRLLPAASLVAAVTVALSWLLQSGLAAKSTAADAVWTSFFGLNIKLASEGTNYLSSEKAPSLLQHYWSLAVEEQYYLVWPLLMLLVALAVRARRRSLPVGLAALLTVVVAASLAVSVWQTSAAQPWAYFGLQARAGELALGALVAVLASRTVRIPEAFGWLGLGMLVTAISVFTVRTPFPGYAVALPVVGTALVILSGCGLPETRLQRVLGRWPLDGLGRISYSWYLWHWPLLWLVPLVVHRTRSLEVDLFSVLVGLLLAVATLKLVENPVRFAHALAAPARSVAMGTGLSFSVAGLAVGITLLPTAVATGASITVDNAATSLEPVVRKSLSVRATPRNLTPPVDKAAQDLPLSHADGCHADFPATTPRRPCVYGAANGAKTMLLFGDSHANQWLPALDTVAKRAGWRLLHRTKSACPPAAMTVFNSVLNRAYPECDAWRQAVFAEVKRLQPDLVVIGGAFAIKGETSSNWGDGMAATMTQLRGAAKSVVFLNDTPYRSDPGPDCVAAHLDDVRACVTPMDKAKPYRPIEKSVRDVVTRAGGRVIDPTRWLCADGSCPAVIGNYLVYRDATHITASYARFLARPLSTALHVEEKRRPS